MRKPPKKIRILFLSILLLLLAIYVYSRIRTGNLARNSALRGIVAFDFNDPASLRGWEQKIFKGKTIYRLKKDSGGGFLDAYSNRSASGLIYWIKFHPKAKPMISWKWKVSKFPVSEGNVIQKTSWIEEQDYAARFYVIFPKFPFFRLQCLEYVWDRELPPETILTNPNFSNLKIIVVESGEANKDKWIKIERNIYEDFKKAFKKEPSSVGAIAIMTDADNTASIAAAQYKDIEVGYEKHAQDQIPGHGATE